MKNIEERIIRFEEEREVLENLLEPMAKKVLEIEEDEFISAYQSDIESFSAYDGIVTVTLVEWHYTDKYTFTAKIPVKVVEENSIDEYVTNLKKEKEELKAYAKTEAAQKEVQRLEARLRILRGELSND